MTLPLHARPGHVTSDPAPCLPGRGAPSPACAASSQVQAGGFSECCRFDGTPVYPRRD